jgi:hypothetical protein
MKEEVMQSLTLLSEVSPLTKMRLQPTLPMPLLSGMNKNDCSLFSLFRLLA